MSDSGRTKQIDKNKNLARSEDLGHLTARITELEAAIRSKEESLCALPMQRTRIKKLEAQVDSVEKLNSDLKDHLEGFRAAKQHLETELSLKQELVVEMFEERDRAENKEAKLRLESNAERLRLESMLEERESEICALTSICDNDKDTISDLREGLERAYRDAETDRAKISALTHRLGRVCANEVIRDEEAGIAKSAPTIIHKWESGENPVAVKLIKNTKGYGWEISVKGEDGNALLEHLKHLEAKVQAKYGTPSE